MIKNYLLFTLFFVFATESTARLLDVAEPIFFHALKEKQFSEIQLYTDIGIKGIKYGKWKKIQLNKYGFYDSDDYLIDQKTHKIRILCLGDSITFGTLTAPYNWPNYLEQMLIDRKYDAEVINASMPGNTFTQLVNLFEAEYVKFKPDIIIIYKGFRSYMAKPGINYPVRYNKLEKLLRYSAFVRHYLETTPKDPYARLKKERNQRGIRETIKQIPTMALDDYAGDLNRLARICRENSTNLIVSPFVTFATKNNLEANLGHVYSTLYYYPALSVEAYLDGIDKFNELTRKIAGQENLAYVDVSDGLEHTKDYFIDNYHLTPNGSKFFATKYFNAVSDLIELRKGEMALKGNT
jgi:lysophospholipase L1-like esterase